MRQFDDVFNYIIEKNENNQEKIHYHMILRLKVKNPIKGVDECNEMIRDLIQAIDMKIVSGPHTVYINSPGNRGLSSVTIIETSHIGVHIWDEQDPALIQFDVFSCKEFTKDQILEFLKNKFEITDLEFVFLDRTNSISVR